MRCRVAVVICGAGLPHEIAAAAEDRRVFDTRMDWRVALHERGKVADNLVAHHGARKTRPRKPCLGAICQPADLLRFGVGFLDGVEH